jgi:DNA-binding IclR family transcriptional regulator
MAAMADHPRDATPWPVLRAVAELARDTAGRPVSVGEVARSTGLPPRRVQRLAAALRARGLLDPLESNDEFAITRAGLHTLRDERDPPGFAEG